MSVHHTYPANQLAKNMKRRWELRGMSRTAYVRTNPRRPPPLYLLIHLFIYNNFNQTFFMGNGNAVPPNDF